jgi:hypothetical protein
MLLESSRNRIENLAPKPIIAAQVASSAIMLRHREDSYEYEKVEIPSKLDFWINRWDTIEYIIRGVLINDGTDALRVMPSGPVFIEGRTPLSPKFVTKPTRIHPSYNMYIIRAKECAIFEWHAGCSVDNWVDIFNNAEFAIPVVGELICLPGSYDVGITSVKLEIGSKALLPIWKMEDKWQVSPGEPIFYVTNNREYLRDANRLRQDLTGEFWDGIRFWPK